MMKKNMKGKKGKGKRIHECRMGKDDRMEWKGEIWVRGWSSVTDEEVEWVKEEWII